MPLFAKVLFVGLEGAGQRELLHTYMQTKFVARAKTFKTVKRTVQVGSPAVGLEVEIRSSAGTELYDETRGTEFYSDADVIVVVFNVTDRESFDSALGLWRAELIDYAPSTPFLFLGLGIEDRVAGHFAHVDSEEAARKTALPDAKGRTPSGSECAEHYYECSTSVRDAAMMKAFDAIFTVAAGPIHNVHEVGACCGPDNSAGGCILS